MGFLTALWLGLLTSLSPCPLATNIAAVSFLSKKISHPWLVFLSGSAYTFGRVIAYTALGFLIVNSFLSVPVLANFLQKYMNKIFGPVLIVTGLALLDVFRLHIPSFSLSEKHQRKLGEAGAGGALVLGALFALVFCPISAALFFGSLIPLVLGHKLGLLMPFMYGVGTGLPVLLFALAIALGVTSLNRWFHQLTRLESGMRKITGLVFIAVGVYYMAVYIFRII